MHLPQCAPHPQCSQAGSICVQRPGIKSAGCQPGARAKFQAASQFAYAPCTCDAFTSMQRISSRKDTADRTFAKSRGNALNSSRVTSPTIVFCLQSSCHELDSYPQASEHEESKPSPTGSYDPEESKPSPTASHDPENAGTCESVCVCVYGCLSECVCVYEGIPKLSNCPLTPRIGQLPISLIARGIQTNPNGIASFQTLAGGQLEPQWH